MYLPAHFAEQRPELILALIQDYPLATLMLVREGDIEADLVPMLLDPDRGEHGTLIGHVARNNALAACDGMTALAMFHGPDAYVSPNWYASKATDGRVVPTWNYAVVEARGTLRCFNEPERLLTLLDRLTDAHEARQPAPWRVADTPADYLDKMLGAIAGIELPLASLTAKFKLSQNRPPADQAGIIAGLTAAGTTAELATATWMVRTLAR